MLKKIILFLILLSSPLNNFCESNNSNQNLEIPLLRPRIVEKKISKFKKVLNFVIRKQVFPRKVVKLNNIKGISGTIPYELYVLIEELKIYKDIHTKNDLTPNKIILYGPPGNGKSTLARKFAELTDSLLIEQKGSVVVQHYVGDGPKKIEDLFEAAEAMADEHNKRVVIFIDEVDAFADNSLKGESIKDYENATQTLWLNLDKYKDSNKIFVILATNKFKQLNPILLDRFGDNIIELPNPDSIMRKEILEYYINKYNVKINTNINELVNQTKKMSIRSIEDLIKSAKRNANLEKAPIVKFANLKEMALTSLRKSKYDDDKTNKAQQSLIPWQKAYIAVGIIVMVAGLIYSVKPEWVNKTLNREVIAPTTTNIKTNFMIFDKESGRKALEQINGQGLLT